MYVCIESVKSLLSCCCDLAFFLARTMEQFDCVLLEIELQTCEGDEAVGPSRTSGKGCEGSQRG